MNLGEIKEGQLESKFVKPGINENVVFVSAEGFDTPEQGYPKIVIQLAKSTVDDIDSMNTRFTLSFKDCDIKNNQLSKVGNYSMTKIVHMINAQHPKAVVEDLSFETLEELGKIMNGLLRKKEYSEFKLSGEENRNPEGEIKVRTNIPLVPFCIGPYSDAKRVLKYDDKNQYDMKRLVEVPEGAAASDDLPF